MEIFTNLIQKNNLVKNDAFIWESKQKKLKAINNIKALNLELIVGIEKQKDILFNNTKNFSLGNFTNNALLWGARGNGKSSLIKSIFLLLSGEYKNSNSSSYGESNFTLDFKS